jgi:hypothetical protein
MEENKIIETRVLSFTEETYEDGTQIIAVKTDDFSDFELIGMLKYYLDAFTVSALQGNIKK